MTFTNAALNASRLEDGQKQAVYPQEASTQNKHESKYDRLCHAGVLLGCLLMAALCLLTSRQKFPWNDEVLTYYMAMDPSLSHMIGALKDQINATPPLYWILVWLWCKVFGGAALSLRLFSCLAFMGAYVVLYRMLCRRFGASGAFFGATCALFLFSRVTEQFSEGRFYGLLFLLCTLALAQCVRLSETDRPALPALALNALLHGALILTHVYGFLYSATFGLIFLLRDIRNRRFVPARYVSILAGWLLFIPWISAFRNQAAIGKPWSWIVSPGAAKLFDAFVVFLLDSGRGFVLFVGFVFAVLWALRTAQQRAGLSSAPALGAQPDAQTERAASSRFDAATFALPLIVVTPVLAWTLSKVATPIFVERYMLPGALGWAILLAALMSARDLTLTGAENVRARGLRAGQGWVACGFLLLIVARPFYLTRSRPAPRRDTQAIETLAAYKNLPIVCENGNDYEEAVFNSPQPARYHFIIDEPQALNTDNAHIALSICRIEKALQRQYPKPTALEWPSPEWERFVKANPRFLVFHRAGITWTQDRLMTDPRYRVTAAVSDAVGSDPQDSLLLAQTNASSP